MLPRNHPRLAAAALVATGTIIFLARRRLRGLLRTLRSERTEAWSLEDLPIARYSDDYLFVYKQHDLHMDQLAPRHAHTAVTLHTMLNARLPELADPKTTTGFRHVHQLDFATSGVLCIALNKRAAGAAGKLFQARAVDKCYLALVDGHTSFDHTRVEAGIGEDASDARGFLMALEGAPGCTGASAATTDVYTVARGALADGRRVSKLLLKPASGRRHQLRLHCVALGHPIVGDVAYSGDHAAPRMCLHAYCLSLPLKAGAACVASADPFPAAGVTRRKSRDDDADDDFDRSMIRVVAAADLELARLLRELRGGEAPRNDVLVSIREGRHRN